MPGALEDGWKSVIEAVLKARGAPALDDPRMGERVATLSTAYNSGNLEVRPPLEARIAFSFARDVPKGSSAVSELELPSKLRIVDIGAGLGAMTWGVARALFERDPAAEIDALLLDEDEAALAAAVAIAKQAAEPRLRIQTKRARVGEPIPDCDLVIVGQVLSELDRSMPEEERATKHAAWITSLLDRAPRVVIVEPALRARSRHLHAIRDRIAAAVEIVSPCLHRQPCPVLAIETEWCHQDRPIDLPPWLVPLARAAGLRWQRLTFAHLVLRRRAATDAVVDSRYRLRVISDRLETKGKIELFGCTMQGERVRLRRLDRDRGPSNAIWDAAVRGDVLVLDPAPTADDRGRIKADVDVRRSEK